ncbi:MAG: hypothetical protein QXN62_06990, partial [Candidatus Bathyarchaeia archaeon]
AYFIPLFLETFFSSDNINTLLYLGFYELEPLKNLRSLFMKMRIFCSIYIQKCLIRGVEEII